MTCYFAFPASDHLRDSSLTLLENFERGVKAPQNKLFIEVAQRFSDEIVDRLLLDIVRGAEANHSGAKVLEGFAGIIKSTVHGLIRQVLGKMSNDELAPLSAVIRERRLTLTQEGVEKDYIAFVMPPAFHARFKAVLEQGARGERNPAELQACMTEFSEMAHTAFYDDSVKPLKLGFIGRKVVDMGGAAIRKGSQASTRRLVPDMQGQELKDFSAYFLGFLITG
ncbi:MAG: hypothetical protein Q8J78_03260 [Moraxellaceae bacterium]|nr:hypothetical protein [Moraxellaceae bacterium]